MSIKKGNPFKNNPIEAAMSGPRKVREGLYRGKLHAGDVGRCPRKAVLHTIQDPSADFVQSIIPDLYMSLGSAMHKVVAQQLKDSGILLASEYHLVEDRLGPPLLKPLGGFVDLIIKNGSDPAIVEVKSCGNQVPHFPKPWHKEQLMVYMLLTGIPHGWVYYLSRNVANWNSLIHKAIPVEYSTSDMRLIARNIATAHVYANAAALPPIPFYHTGPKDCGFCPFTKICWEEKRITELVPSLETKVTSIQDKILKSRDKRYKKTMEEIS